jgi:hypothetical protein
MFQKWPPNPPLAPSPPPAPPPRDLAFLALADWGGQTDWPMTTDAQLQCAPTMASVATQLQASHVVSAGDNFYDAGVAGTTRVRRCGAALRGPWGIRFRVLSAARRARHRQGRYRAHEHHVVPSLRRNAPVAERALPWRGRGAKVARR